MHCPLWHLYFSYVTNVSPTHSIYKLESLSLLLYSWLAFHCILSISCSVGGHLGFCSSAVHICNDWVVLYISLHIFASVTLEYIPRMGLLGKRVNVYIILLAIPKFLFIWTVLCVEWLSPQPHQQNRLSDFWNFTSLMRNSISV